MFWVPKPFVSVQLSGSAEHLAWALLIHPGVAIVNPEDWDPLLSGGGDRLGRSEPRQTHRIVAAPQEVSSETLFVAPITEVWPSDRTVPFDRLVLDTSGYELPQVPDSADQLEIPIEERAVYIDALKMALKDEPPGDWLPAANRVAAQQSTNPPRPFPFTPADARARTVCELIKLCPWKH
jgi:hypothetical protein